MRGWFVVLVALALLFLVALGVAVGLDWLVEVFWPWSGVALLAVISIVGSWLGRNWLRTRGPRRRFRAELVRIGVADSTLVDLAPNGSVWIAGGEGPQGSHEYTWDGSAADALRRLTSVADEGGSKAFWQAFPERERWDKTS